MTAFSDAIDVIFADDDLAVDGVYTPTGESPISVKVVMHREEEGAAIFGSGAVIGVQLADIRTSELTSVTEGDSLIIGSSEYTVSRPERRDTDRYVWTMSLVEA